MKVIYTGPIDAVYVPEADVVAPRGEPVEILADIAKRLLEQKPWKKAPKPKTKQKADS